MADYTVTGDTRLDTSGFTKGISSMTVAAGNLISGLVSTATSKMAGLAKSSVSVGMSFEASMSQVAATMGKSAEEIESLTRVAKEMGSSTKFSATQAADALNYLALAGYDADKAAEVLPSVLNLAAAGGMDLAYASDLVTDAMASLNIEANKNNVDDFGNKLAMAASKANANVSQLGEAILTVGGTAANLKNGTTELTTALGLLANVGLKGAEGGTHLRNIILSLQSPTDDAAKLIQQLGLQVYDAQGNMRGLDEILGDLNTRMVGMTQGQKDSIINRLFNKTDLAAVNGLLAAQGEQWDALAAQIDAAGGAMEQMAETQQDNLQGVMTSMSSAFEGLQLAVYERLEPALTDAGSWGVECIRNLTDALSNGGPEAMLSAAGGILSALAAGIVEQLPGMVSAGVNIIAYLAQSLVAATPEMLTTGASIVGALVDSLSSALPQLLHTGIEMLSQLGAGLVQGIPELLTQALPLVADLASGLRENAGKLVDAGIEFIFNLMQGLMDGLPTLIEYLPGIVSDLAGIINDNAPKLLAAGAHLIVMLGRGLLEALPTIIENIPQICKAIFDVFTAFRWLDIGSQIVTGLWTGLKSGWTGLISKVQGLAQQLPDIVKKVLGIHSPSRIFAEIGQFICEGFKKGIEEHTPEVTQAAADLAEGTVEAATAAAEKAVPDTLSGLWSVLKDRANEGILGTVDTLWSAVKSGDWVGIGKWVASTLYSGLTADQKQQLTDYALSLVDGLNGVLGQGAQGLAQAAWSLGQSLYNGITGKFGDVASLAGQLSGTLQDTFAALKGPLGTAAKAISTALSGNLLSAFPTIFAAMGTLVTTVGSAFVAMLESIGAAISATGIGLPVGAMVIAAGVALAVAIAAIAMKLGSSSRSSVKTPNSSSGSGSAVTAPSYSLWDYEKETARPERKPRPSYEINQYIYSKAQTAADLMREARYEQERAVLAGV